ncbi:MAG: phytanoyl-CoA dioxygenase [Chitinophagaceae bacterium]|nr:MAG: phytanoyl-CoA dioxygenase [Chitinophagaceae bacterium]
MNDTAYEPGPALGADEAAALTRLWNGAMEGGGSNRWDNDLRAVSALGLGMQELLQYLYQRRPGLPEFLLWAEQHRSSTEAPPVEEDTLGPADLAHWQEHGYVLIRKAVTGSEHRAAARAIWEFLDASPDDPASWYRPHDAKSGMMLTLTQHPALRAVRASARIRRAYEQLYGSTAIYPVVDKVSFNPPERAHYSFMGSRLHWDTSLALPIPGRLQGLLYLTDTGADDGAFHCVPGFHHRIGDWLAALPAGTEPREAAPALLASIPIEGAAGDFIIWHSALPHCASPNRGNTPRLVQYLTYLPDGFEDHRPWR